MADEGPYPLEEPPPEISARPHWPDIVPEGPRCRRCGYELKGLPMKGECPECGLGVVWSLRANLLRYSNPAYVRRLAIGALLIELGIAAVCLVPLGAVFIAAATLNKTIPSWLFATLSAAAAMLSIGGVVLGLAGMYLLTARDPGFAVPDESDRSRRVTRIATIVCAACLGVGAAISGMATLAAAAPAGFAVLAGTASVGTALAMVVQMLASMYHLQHLAKRVPDWPLRETIGTTRKVGIALLACMAATVVLAMAREVACLALVSALAGAILLLVFAWQYAYDIDRTRRNMRDIWRAGNAGGVTPA